MKYWLRFNEINSVLHESLMSGGIYTDKNKLNKQDLYQVVYHELVAHEMIPGVKVGCMIFSMPVYPLGLPPVM